MNSHASIGHSGASSQDSGPSDDLIDTRFTVPSMRCAGCISKVENGLADVDGVASARVNFSAKRVAIRHLPTLDEEALTLELQKLGFEAQPIADNPLATDDKEAKNLLRALAVAGFGMMNIMLLSVSVWAGAGGVTKDLFHWLSAAIALPVIAYSGRVFFASAIMALRYRRTNMDVPISIGVLLAAALSFYETITGGEHAYFDGAVMLLFFLLCGRALDAMMRNKTRAGIGALLGRMGNHAQVIMPDGSTSRIKARDLEIGMVMQVAAGEALAADGIVLEGNSAVDNAMLTGESAPEPALPDSVVLAGATNLLAPIKVTITAIAADTAIAEIARLMDEAGQSRSRYVRIADRASKLYAPVVHSLALLAFVGWMVIGAGWHQSLTVAISVLIITCPCAMGLAVPAAQVVASNALIRRGLLVKDGSALERLAQVDIALFDKTGTLTLGAPRPDLSRLEEHAKSIALALAQTSRHPLSKGLVASLQAEGITPSSIGNVREQAGRGIMADWDGIQVALERPDASIETGAALASSLHIGDQVWTIPFTDPPRTDVAQTLSILSDMGLKSSIISGDRKAPVEAAAALFGIEAQAELSPADKLAHLERLKSEGHFPLMVGDGLNDGPALAAAHASIAPGTASDVSQQAADAVFIGEGLMPIAFAVKVARRTMDIVRQNFALAIVYNVLAVPLALAGLVTPLIAAIAMSLSSLVVVANSLRLASAAK